MSVDPATPKNDEAQKLLVLCAVDPTQPDNANIYPLQMDKTTGELRVNAEFTGEILVKLSGAGPSGDNVRLVDEAGNKVDVDAVLGSVYTTLKGIDGVTPVTIEAVDALKAIKVSIERLVDSVGNEAKVDAVLESLQVVVKKIEDSSGNEALVNATLSALQVAVEQLRDSAGNEALVNGTLDALQVDVKTALSGYSISDDAYYFIQKLDQTLPSGLVSGNDTVATAGVAEQLNSGTPLALKRGVGIQALITNTGKVFVGGSNVDNANGEELTKGQDIFMEVSDVSEVWIDVSVNGEGVKWTGS